MLEDRLEDDFELEERFEEELLERMEDNNDDSDDTEDDDTEETVDVWERDTVVKVEYMLDVREGIGAYVNTTAGEAVVVDAGVGRQDVVNGCGEATTAGLKLCEEDDLVDETDDDTADAVMAVVLDDAGIMVAPHVHIDTHVQIEEHVHENVDACVQVTAVASESDGTAPGGNEGISGVDDSEEDTVESFNEVDAGHVDEDDIDNEDMESVTGDDAGGIVGGGDEDAASNGGSTGAVACVVFCADGGTGGCPRGNDPEVAFLMMSAACSTVRSYVAKVLSSFSSNLFGYTIYDSLQMTCRDDWHDRRVDQSQVLSAIHKQPWIHDSSQIKRQHGASTTWMELCLYTGLDELHDLMICSVWARIEL